MIDNDKQCRTVFIVNECYGYDGRSMVGLYDNLDDAVTFVEETLIGRSRPSTAEGIDIEEIPVGWNGYDEKWDTSELVGPRAWWINRRTGANPRSGWKRSK
jgi:hypothetical protein